jgi:hypothetical protein
MRTTQLLALCIWLLGQGYAVGAESRILKVLPYLLDSEGRHALQPSLYERDAYQAKLRTESGLAQGRRYDVQWRVAGPRREGAILRLELRSGSGNEGRSLVLECPLKPGWRGRGWSRLQLTPEQFKELGQVTAWRATLRQGEAELAEEKSFLW